MRDSAMVQPREVGMDAQKIHTSMHKKAHRARTEETKEEAEIGRIQKKPDL